MQLANFLARGYHLAATCMVREESTSAAAVCSESACLGVDTGLDLWEPMDCLRASAMRSWSNLGVLAPLLSPLRVPDLGVLCMRAGVA